MKPAQGGCISDSSSRGWKISSKVGDSCRGWGLLMACRERRPAAESLCLLMLETHEARLRRDGGQPELNNVPTVKAQFRRTTRELEVTAPPRQ